MNPFFPIPPALQAADQAALEKAAPVFANIERIKEYNQLKMLHSFHQQGLASNHLSGTTGYGYDDVGRDKLEKIFATLTQSESAIFRHNFVSGTHTLAIALQGILRPGHVMLCATGQPYDTLHGVIGLNGARGTGNLADFGVQYRQLELAEGRLDLPAIKEQAKGARMLYLQRSCGYASRPTLTLGDIAAAAEAAKSVNPQIVVMVDNCYGEFTQTEEPTQHGADLMAGSLIKNPGGGIAPTGGYIAGKQHLVELCAQRLTAPGVGGEVGCTPGDILRQLYLGLYFAPGVTAEALKTATYAAALFEQLGYTATPGPLAARNDIITAIHLHSAEHLKRFCQAIQSMSPVDSHLTPEPWPMPGYDCDVIMAAGAFTLGSSIELSCDGPMRPPYIAFLQGSLNFATGRAAVLKGAQAVVQGT